MKYKNLVILGTSHIAIQSVNDVKTLIEEEDPSVVALELDKKRFFGLLTRKKEHLRLKDIRKIGIKGYLFALIGAYVERKLGENVGMKPGSEMLTAIKIANQKGIKIALIDQDIEITLRRFSDEITWKEKFRIIFDLIKSLIFGKREFKKLRIKEIDLTKVPQKKLIKRMVREVKKRYPSIYKVLIEERNKVMAKNLKRLMKEEKKVLAIVGAGHEEDMIKLVKSKNI